MTTDTPTYFTREMLESELADVERILAKHLDAVITWTDAAGAGDGPGLEWHLTEIRYWATNAQTLNRLVATDLV